MHSLIRSGAMTLALAGVSASAWADGVEGTIERNDAAQRSFTVQGISFVTSAATDYDEGLQRFGDLPVGQRVEVDFDNRDGRHIATEVEPED